MKNSLLILFSFFLLLAGALCACGNPTATSTAAKSAAPTTAPIALHSGGRIDLYNCTFQTLTGYYLTAVGGGGHTTDAIHTDATRVGSWEKFTLLSDGPILGNNMAYSFRTFVRQTYLTAVGGGGRITDVIHSDATVDNSWEFLTLVPVQGDIYAIETIHGFYLTAVDGGGRTTDTIHSDATRILAWEEFHVHCDEPIPAPF